MLRSSLQNIKSMSLRIKFLTTNDDRHEQFLMNHISQSVNKSLQTCGMREIYKSFSS